MERVAPTPAGLRRAAQAIARGEIVAYPAETLYGLAADPFSERAVQRLFEAKDRAPSEPIPIIIADYRQLATAAGGASPKAEACARAFWPGPLSLVFPRSRHLADCLCAGNGTVCIRFSSSAVALALARAFGGPITATSANRSGAPPATRPEDVKLSQVSICIDGGELKGGLPSTIFDPDSGLVLRRGAVAPAELERFSKG